ncbi:outer membrane protein assembly factor BamC [Azovibrio restrictus]|uniref:outer membrane protein assembly factor BamC n=1 Tax=Azovibrio restrictus TaxID=146938 RepID=UPI0026E9A1D4|nr:outer membrane protein assembly factor BamC [Azovibrio restrictus]
MRSRVSPLVLGLLAVSLGGCSSLIPETKKIDYKSAGKAPTLEVPPDLTQLSRDDRFAVPDFSARGSATFSEYSAERGPGAAAAQNSVVLPQIDNVRIERSGNQRWLVVTAPPDRLWDSVKDFWQELGFIIVTEMPEAGIMETDWAENRAKIPSDIIRNTLGKLLDSLYSTGERDKFRTRFEPGATPGTTEIFISNRRMEEVYTSSAQEDTRWQPAAPDPELEAEMLRRLMVRLGTDERRAEAALASARAEERAKLVRSGDGSGVLEVQERFDRAWRRVGLALDRVGFTVEDRDRSRGMYYVRYVDPETDGKKKDDGWLSRLAVWKSDSKSAPQSRYRIFVEEVAGSTRVQVLTPEGGVDRTETSKKILALLFDQLR